MAKVGNIVIYRPKEGRENDLLELVKKHWATARDAGLATDEPARIWRATDRRTGRVSFVERFAWVSDEAAGRAHHDPALQGVWVPMDEVMEDMTIMVVEEIPGHPPAKAAPRRPAARTAPKRSAAPKRRKAARATAARASKKRAPVRGGRKAGPARGKGRARGKR